MTLRKDADFSLAKMIDRILLQFIWKQMLISP